MVIFNHIRSLISNPESGLAIAATMVGMSVFTVKWISSNGPELTINNNNYINEPGEELH